jgi:hypothetical protein
VVSLKSLDGLFYGGIRAQTLRVQVKEIKEKVV